MIPLFVVSVVAFGAVGDGVHDDRPAIQAAIDAAREEGSAVFFPRGEYLVSRAGSAYYTLLVDGVDLAGEGRDVVTIRQAAGIAAGVRVMHVTGTGVTIEDITIDGDKAHQSVSEWRHGVFAFDVEGLTVRRVITRDLTGDGIYLYRNVSDAVIEDVIASDNDRNGFTFGATVTGVEVRGGRFTGNRAQQIDTEPGGTAIVSNISITGAVLDGAGVSNDYALTISGTSLAAHGHDWRIEGCVINGGIFVVWAEDVVIARNVGTNPTTKPSVDIWRSSHRVHVLGNDLSTTQVLVPWVPVVMIVGTTGSSPADIVVAGNRLRLGYALGMGIRAEGAESVSIVGNELIGPGVAAPSRAGVNLRATATDRDFVRATVTDNVISGFGDRGVQVRGNGSARLLFADISRNTFVDLPTAVSLDDGTGALQTGEVVGNVIGSGVARGIVDIPANVLVTP